MFGIETQHAPETVGGECWILHLTCCKEAHLEPEPCVFRICLQGLLPVPGDVLHLSQAPIDPAQLSMIIGLVSTG